jgi:ubiquinone/menaquinone biosynthesis C-methylase UbiE
MDRAGISSENEYLCVEAFIADLAGARALASAFELGLIDHLLAHQPCTESDLAGRAKLDARGLGLLLGLLRANRVVERDAAGVRLSPPFGAALRYRDLLEAKLDFAAIAAPDFLESFTTLLADPKRFQGVARIFELFSYQRCYDPTPENYANTARWMRITTALTKYEAGACLSRHDFSAYRRMLDVGGNSGEFALQACRRHAALRATVLDLPLVCDLGARHLGKEPESGRIDFVKVDREVRPFPGGYDLVTFKSMLHDWPEAEMRGFLARAHEALAPGGTVLIFERCSFEAGEAGRGVPLPYGALPIALFFRSYRERDAYAAPLAEAGFRDVRIETFELDLPFVLVTARK